jgi:hypothetical protein
MRRKPRTIKVLLELVLENIFFLNEGFCDLIRGLKAREEISIEEHAELRKYLRDNEYPNETIWRPYWWKPGDKEPRIAWLKEHIKRNTKSKKPMKKFVKIELVTWGIFSVSVIIIVVPLLFLFTALNVPERVQKWICFGLGFILMGVIGRVVRKRME